MNAISTSFAIEIANELGITSDLLAARNFRECAEAECLVVAETSDNGREYLLTGAAATAWRKLKAAAENDGVTLFIVSAFRSVARQADIIRRKLDAGLSIEEILAYLAPPGFSEHHSGRAVDISTPGSAPAEVEFEQTAAFSWLMQHANRFGFYLSYPEGNVAGYQYEPWHWCFHNQSTLSNSMTTMHGLNLNTLEAKAFIPARDFSLSIKFYQAIGFTMAHQFGDVAYFHHGDSSFLLQRFYNEELANNFQMHLLVENVDDWWQHLADAQIAEEFGVKLIPPQNQPWGMRDFILFDPTGVMWRIGQNIR